MGTVRRLLEHDRLQVRAVLIREDEHGRPLDDVALSLGRVDKVHPLFDCSQFGGAEEAACGMVVSGGDASAILEPIEEALNPVSGRIQGAVDRVLDMAVSW